MSLTLNGKYNSAEVFTDDIDSVTIGQAIELLNQQFTSKSKVRIMPDCHAGAGCVIGTTMTIQDKIVPNLVGVDINCSVLVANIGKVKNLDFSALDNHIRNHIPSGHDVFDTERDFDLSDLACKSHIDINRALCSIGTLGGGNHFIEVDKDSDDNVYVVIHSGSRYLGKQVAEYYQEKAYKSLTDRADIIYETINNLKAQGRQTEIPDAIKKIKRKIPSISKDLAYVEGSNFYDYLHDMKIIQTYASANRLAMLKSILSFLGTNTADIFETMHNYVDLENMILRKGAISAQNGERVIIPMNMRDGSLICLGKGNPDWNFSAPHGAGRIMSRSQARSNVDMEEFRKSMDGVFSTSVCESTIDESPMVYKPMEEIMGNIQDTVQIIKVIKPIYNFKAGS